MSKEILRQNSKITLKTLDLRSLSMPAISAIKQHPKWQSSRHIMLYSAMSDEIDIWDISRNTDKKIYIPHICNEIEMLPVCIDDIGENTKISWAGIYDDDIAPIHTDASVLDLIIIPALAYSHDLYRLGRGAGYYDRFCQQYNNAYRLGLIPKEVYIEKIPMDIWDIQVNDVILV